jgi:predicted ester cyclase
LGFKATNKPVRFSGMTIARFQNGKLVEGWNVFDQLSMFQQLGIFTPPV